LLELLREDPSLATRFERLRSIEAPEVDVLTRRLTDRRLVDNPTLLRTLVVRATGPEGFTPTAETAISALAPATDPELGTGLARLREESSTLARTLDSDRIVESGVLTDVDRLARDVPAASLPELATELRTAVRTGENIPENLAALRRRFVP
jgi:hypothetical protein